jgi:3-hydroxyisobutyrate dehydrogenase-like beta-hydroxyacid dehydrogenase
MVGGIRGVVAGTVTLFAGGDEAVLDDARPDMAAWTSTIHHVGPLGAGQVAKSANNLVHWAQVCAIDEALRVVAAAGLSVPAVRRALADGPADSRALHEIEQMKFTWWNKDLVGFRELAERVGSPHRVSDMCSELMPDITVDSIAELLEKS